MPINLVYPPQHGDAITLLDPLYAEAEGYYILPYSEDAAWVAVMDGGEVHEEIVYNDEWAVKGDD